MMIELERKLSNYRVTLRRSLDNRAKAWLISFLRDCETSKARIAQLQKEQLDQLAKAWHVRQVTIGPGAVIVVRNVQNAEALGLLAGQLYRVGGCRGVLSKCGLLGVRLQLRRLTSARQDDLRVRPVEVDAKELLHYLAKER